MPEISARPRIRTPIVRRPPTPERLAAMREHFRRETTRPTDLDDERADQDYPYDLARQIRRLTDDERRALVLDPTGAAPSGISATTP